MQHGSPLHVPLRLKEIVTATQQEVPTFTDSHCDPLTGALLRSLAASKPGGTLLEIGTGTGLATAWIADGMDHTAHLTTLEKRKKLAEIAQRILGQDQRITFLLSDATPFLLSHQPNAFDIIFADAGVGKYHLLAETLLLLKKGGFYIIDHLHYEQPHSTEEQEHAARIQQVIAALEQREDVILTSFDWSSGVLLAVKFR